MAPVKEQAVKPQDNRPENYKKVVIRKSQYGRRDHLSYFVEVELHSGGTLRIAMMLHGGDAHAYGEEVARRVGCPFRSYV